MPDEATPDPAVAINPWVDPSANVLNLVKAAIDRQDDLRVMAERLRESEVKRLDELRLLTKTCAEEIQAVHLQGARDLATAETKRIDALLLATKADAALVAEKATAQAATLATAVASSAEALRSQVSTLATQTNTQTAQMREAIEKRLQLLEQSQYAIGGRDTQRIESRTSGAQSTGAVMAVIGTAFAAFGVLVTAAIAIAALLIS